MFVTSLDDLPESLRSQFVEAEIDGTKGFQDKDSFELRKHLFNVKDENKTLKESRAELDQKLTQFEQSKQTEIEAARAKALEEARSKGDVKAIEERYQQQMADLEKRVEERTRDAMKKEFEADRANDLRESIIKQLSMKGIDEGAREAMRDSLERHVTVCPDTYQIVFKDGKGGALSVDAAGFEAEMLKMPKFSRLMEVRPPNSGAGAANGSGGASTTRKTFDQLTGAELSAIRKQNPSEYERLKSEYHQRN